MCPTEVLGFKGAGTLLSFLLKDPSKRIGQRIDTAKILPKKGRKVGCAWAFHRQNDGGLKSFGAKA